MHSLCVSARSHCNKQVSCDTSQALYRLNAHLHHMCGYTARGQILGQSVGYESAKNGLLLG